MHEYAPTTLNRLPQKLTRIEERGKERILVFGGVDVVVRCGRERNGERKWVIARSGRSASACEGSSGKSLRSGIGKEISKVVEWGCDLVRSWSGMISVVSTMGLRKFVMLRLWWRFHLVYAPWEGEG